MRGPSPEGFPETCGARALWYETEMQGCISFCFCEALCLEEEGCFFILKEKGGREAERWSKTGRKGMKDPLITFDDDIKLSGIVIALEDLE